MSIIPNAIYGGIIGDMVGSVYENNPCLKNKVDSFPLWTGKAKLKKKMHESQRVGSRFTDDTVTGLAVAKTLMEIKDFKDDNAVKRAFAKNMKDLCPLYEWAGYGSRFWVWLTAPEGNLNNEPYQSYGNGSAMRVFPVGLMFDSLEETRRIARLSAVITHDHEEGVKGAEAVASAMFLARAGKDKDEIRRYIINEFATTDYYTLNKSCNEIRPEYKFDVSCQGSVPESIQCFLEGKNYEECVRLAVSLGGDADTMGCIAGAIAACIYPIPAKMIKQARARLTPELRGIADGFNEFLNVKE